jgi:hypothetical protein
MSSLSFPRYGLGFFYVYLYHYLTARNEININSTPNKCTNTLIKKKTKFSSYMRKFRWDRVKSHYEQGLPII